MDDPNQFPPGTLYLERSEARLYQASSRKTTDDKLLIVLDARHAETVLHPTPSTDPNDPLNWSKWYKAWNFFLGKLRLHTELHGLTYMAVCYFTLMVFVAVDIGTVIYGQLYTDLGISYAAENTSFGLNTAGLALGCIFFIPFALKFGRRPVYLASIAVQMACCIWQGKMQTNGDLEGSNFIAGLAGACAEALAQMTIADIFFVHQRGTANAVYLLMVNIGAFLSLIPAGVIAVNQGWRWIWWWTTILLGVALLAFIFGYDDTKYTPVVSGVQVQSVNDDVERSSQTKDDDDVKIAQVTTTQSRPIDQTIPRKTYWQRMALVNNTPGWHTFFRHMYQPFIILFLFPAVTWSALMYGSLLAWFSLGVSSYSIYFTIAPYNFSSEAIGLMSLAPFIGSVIGSVVSFLTVDRSIVWLSRRNGGIFEPEMRLWLVMPAVVLMPAGILWFGLSMANGDAWIVPAVGLGVFGFAFTLLGDVALTYCMDCYTELVGDMFIAIVFVRNAFATVIATALQAWINGVGLRWVFITSTILAFALSLLTIPMMWWGKKARIWTKTRYEYYAARQYSSRMN